MASEQPPSLPELEEVTPRELRQAIIITARSLVKTVVDNQDSLRGNYDIVEDGVRHREKDGELLVVLERADEMVIGDTRYRLDKNNNYDLDLNLFQLGENDGFRYDSYAVDRTGRRKDHPNRHNRILKRELNYLPQIPTKWLLDRLNLRQKEVSSITGRQQSAASIITQPFKRHAPPDPRVA